MKSTQSLEMPPLFRDALLSSQLVDVDAWWENLDHRGRLDAIDYWNSVASEEVSGFRIEARPSGGNSAGWEESDGYWQDDFYEYLINHEVTWFEEPTFHVCHQTSAARRALSRGSLTPKFECPLRHVKCAMKRLLEEAGSAVCFRLVPVTGKA